MVLLYQVIRNPIYYFLFSFGLLSITVIWLRAYQASTFLEGLRILFFLESPFDESNQVKIAVNQASALIWSNFIISILLLKFFAVHYLSINRTGISSDHVSQIIIQSSSCLKSSYTLILIILDPNILDVCIWTIWYCEVCTIKSLLCLGMLKSENLGAQNDSTSRFELLSQHLIILVAEISTLSLFVFLVLPRILKNPVPLAIGILLVTDIVSMLVEILKSFLLSFFRWNNARINSEKKDSSTSSIFSIVQKLGSFLSSRFHFSGEKGSAACDLDRWKLIDSLEDQLFLVENICNGMLTLISFFNLSHLYLLNGISLSIADILLIINMQDCYSSMIHIFQNLHRFFFLKTAMDLAFPNFVCSTPTLTTPTSSSDHEKNELVCSICLGPLEMNLDNVVKGLPCGHGLHRECLQQLIIRSIHREPMHTEDNTVPVDHGENEEMEEIQEDQSTMGQNERVQWQRKLWNRQCRIHAKHCFVSHFQACFSCQGEDLLQCSHIVSWKPSIDVFLCLAAAGTNGSTTPATPATITTTTTTTIPHVSPDAPLESRDQVEASLNTDQTISSNPISFSSSSWAWMTHMQRSRSLSPLVWIAYFGSGLGRAMIHYLLSWKLTRQHYFIQCPLCRSRINIAEGKIWNPASPPLSSSSSSGSNNNIDSHNIDSHNSSNNNNNSRFSSSTSQSSRNSMSSQDPLIGPQNRTESHGEVLSSVTNISRLMSWTHERIMEYYVYTLAHLRESLNENDERNGPNSHPDHREPEGLNGDIASLRYVFSSQFNRSISTPGDGRIGNNNQSDNDTLPNNISSSSTRDVFRHEEQLNLLTDMFPMTPRERISREMSRFPDVHSLVDELLKESTS